MFSTKIDSAAVSFSVGRTVVYRCGQESKAHHDEPLLFSIGIILFEPS